MLSSKSRYLEQQSQVIDRLSSILSEFGLSVRADHAQRAEMLDASALPPDHIIHVTKPLYGNILALTISISAMDLHYASDVVIPNVADNIIAEMCPSVPV
jgi:hypothetical protein